MRAVRFHDHGGTEVLEVEEIDRPTPSGHQVLVEVAAAGVNPVDTYLTSAQTPCSITPARTSPTP